VDDSDIRTADGCEEVRFAIEAGTPFRIAVDSGGRTLMATPRRNVV
jgi:hypothetical protein